jgi:hypothetical protein
MAALPAGGTLLEALPGTQSEKSVMNPIRIVVLSFALLTLVQPAQAQTLTHALVGDYVIDIPETFQLTRWRPAGSLQPSSESSSDLDISGRFEQVLVATAPEPGAAFLTVNARPNWDILYATLRDATPETWRVLAGDALAPTVIMVGRGALVTARGEPLVTETPEGALLLAAEVRAELCQERCAESVVVGTRAYFLPLGSFEVAFAIGAGHPAEPAIREALATLRLLPAE